MIVEKLYLQCLSHASYILHSNGEAAVVDPQRDVEEYLKFLADNKLSLKFILETHLHADFVSGHLELAQRSGARIVFGEKAGVNFDHISVTENSILKLGDVEIKVLETPGHTPEGVCYLFENTADSDQDLGIFTGDTLFSGDVGRPDLMDEFISAKELGGMLYDSLRQKIMTLPPETKVYPAHGTGSSCGRELTDVEYTTIGQELETNYALQDMSKEDFIAEVTADQPIAPKYFLQSAALNREGLPSVSDVLANFTGYSVDQFASFQNDPNYQILDVRDPEVFTVGHIPGSINIGLDGRYAEWVGSLLNEEQSIIFVAEPGTEKEAAIRCARVGFDLVAGYLEGGFEAWSASNRQVANFGRLNPEEFDSKIQSNPDTKIIDVRRASEYRISHMPNSIHIPLHKLEEELPNLSHDDTYAVYCQGGYRSIIATSIMYRNGFKDIVDLRDGFSKYLEKNSAVHLH